MHFPNRKLFYLLKFKKINYFYDNRIVKIQNNLIPFKLLLF